jgi:hypothetical protein
MTTKTPLGLFMAAALLLFTAPNLQAATPEDGVDTLRGQVIDLSCKVVHNLDGEDHRMCTQVCGDAGVPLAILGEDGNIYLPVSREMPSSGDELNALLRPHAERSVTIEGQIVQRAGTRGIIIESVRAN